MIKNNFKFKLFLKKRKERISVFGLSPGFDWKFLIGVFVLIFSVGIINVGTLYMRVNNGSAFDPGEIEDVSIELNQRMQKIEEVVEKIPEPKEGVTQGEQGENNVSTFDEIE